MSLSRVESRKNNKEAKKQKKTNRRKLLYVNTILLALVLIIVAVFYSGESVIDYAKEWAAGLTTKKVATDEGAEPSQPGSDQVSKDSSNDVTQPDSDQVSKDSSNVVNQPVVKDEENDSTTIPEQTENPDGNDSSIPPSSSPDPVEQDDTYVQLAFVGDILQGEYISSLLQEHGYLYPYEKALFSLSNADITAGNLELPFTTGGTPAKDKTYVFNGEPEALAGIRDSGIDIVNLANNHTLDMGEEGLLDTMQHLDQYNIAHVGAGNNAEEAYSPVIIEKNGIKVGFLGVSRVLPVNEWKATPYQAGLAETYDPKMIVEAIEKTKENVDIVVILVHWGKEREQKPVDHQVDLAKRYIDAGADIIVGSHPHVLQGFEQYNGKWIAYSLGNFVFSVYPQGKQAETGVLNATCNKEASCELSFVPMKVKVGQPTPVEADEQLEMIEYLQSISLGNVKIDERGQITVDDSTQ